MTLWHLYLASQTIFPSFLTFIVWYFHILTSITYPNLLHSSFLNSITVVWSLSPSPSLPLSLLPYLPTSSTTPIHFYIFISIPFFTAFINLYIPRSIIFLINQSSKKAHSCIHMCSYFTPPLSLYPSITSSHNSLCHLSFLPLIAPFLYWITKVYYTIPYIFHPFPLMHKYIHF